MEYQITKAAENTTVRLSGEIDLHVAPDLRDVLLDVVNAGENLVVNLQDVQYMDSSGVACFVEAYQKSKKAGHQFLLSQVSQPVMRVFKLARLDTVFPIEPHG